MKKVLSLFFAIIMIISVLSLTSCGYSSDSIVQGLKKANYTVGTYTPASFEEAQVTVALKTSTIKGLKTVIHAFKTEDSKTTEEFIVLVFDSINSASALSEADLSLLNDFASKYTSHVLGTANNVVYAGTSAAKEAAGIKTMF